MSNHCGKNWSSRALHEALGIGQPVAEDVLELLLGDVPAAVGALDVVHRGDHPVAAEDLPEREVRGAGRLYVKVVVKRVPTVGFDGAPVQNVVLVVP